MQKKYLYLNIFIFILSRFIIGVYKIDNNNQLVQDMPVTGSQNDHWEEPNKMMIQKTTTQLILGLQDIFDENDSDLSDQLSEHPLGQLFLSGFEKSFKNESSQTMIYLVTLQNILNNNHLGDKSLWSILKQFILKIYELKIFENIESINRYFNDIPPWALEFQMDWLTSVCENNDQSKKDDEKKKMGLETILTRDLENILNDLMQLYPSKYKSIFLKKINKIFNGMDIKLTEFQINIKKIIEKAKVISQKEMIKLNNFITDRLLRILINATDKVKDPLLLPEYFLLSDIYKSFPMEIRIFILEIQDNILYNSYSHNLSLFEYFEKLRFNNLKLLIGYGFHELRWGGAFIEDKSSYKDHCAYPMELILDSQRKDIIYKKSGDSYNQCYNNYEKYYDDFVLCKKNPSFYQQRFIVDQIFIIPSGLFETINKYKKEYLTFNNGLIMNYFSINILCRLHNTYQEKWGQLPSMNKDFIIKAQREYIKQLLNKLQLWNVTINDIDYIKKELLKQGNFSFKIHNALIIYLKKYSFIFNAKKQQFFKIIRNIINQLKDMDTNSEAIYTNLFFFMTYKTNRTNNHSNLEFNINFNILNTWLYIFLLFSFKDNIIKMFQQYAINIHHDLQTFIIKNNFTLLDLQKFSQQRDTQNIMMSQFIINEYENIDRYYKENKKISMTDLSTCYEEIACLFYNHEYLTTLYHQICYNEFQSLMELKINSMELEYGSLLKMMENQSKPSMYTKINKLASLIESKKNSMQLEFQWLLKMMKVNFKFLLIKNLQSIDYNITMQKTSQKLMVQFIKQYYEFYDLHISHSINQGSIITFINEMIWEIIIKNNEETSLFQFQRKLKCFHNYYTMTSDLKKYHNNLMFKAWIITLTNGLINNYEFPWDSIGPIIYSSIKDISYDLMNVQLEKSIQETIISILQSINHQLIHQNTLKNYDIKGFKEIEIYIKKTLIIQKKIPAAIEIYKNQNKWIIFWTLKEEITNKFYEKLNKIIVQLKINDVEILLSRWNDVVQAL